MQRQEYLNQHFKRGVITLKLMYEINEYGYFIGDRLVKEQDDYPSNYVEHAPPTHVKGFYKPKWNGTTWIEGATQEEIDELTKPQPAPPTVEQRLAELENTILTLLEVL